MKRIVLFVFLLYPLVINAMFIENKEVAAKMRSIIAQKMICTGLCSSHADYQNRLSAHLKKLEECPLLIKNNIYLIMYRGQEWSMYFPPPKA